LLLTYLTEMVERIHIICSFSYMLGECSDFQSSLHTHLHTCRHTLPAKMNIC